MYAILLIALIVALAILDGSARKNERKYWEDRAKRSNPPEHEMVDNQADTSVWVVAMIVLFIGVLLAVH